MQNWIQRFSSYFREINRFVVDKTDDRDIITPDYL